MLKKLTLPKNRGYVYYFYVYNNLAPIKLRVSVFKVHNFDVQSLFGSANRK